MVNIGIFVQNNIDIELKTIFKEKNYPVTTVTQKKLTKEINGLIMTITDRNQLNVIIEMLRELKYKKTCFIWIYSQISLEYERELLMLLGVTSIIIGEDEFKYFILMIENSIEILELNFADRIKKSQNTYVLNDKNHSIYIDGREQELSYKEYMLVHFLYANKNQCVTYQQLLSSLWSESSMDKKYLVANLVFHLREKLEKKEGITIKTVRSRGYMLKIDFGE